MESYRSNMLRQDELASVKALSTFQVSPAFLKQLRIALDSRKKRLLVPAESRSIIPAGGARDTQRSWSRLAGKRKDNQLASTATRLSPPTGAQHLSMGPLLCPGPLQPRVNKLLHAAGNSGPPSER